jgi:ribosomal protein L37AE/L43A
MDTTIRDVFISPEVILPDLNRPFRKVKLQPTPICDFCGRPGIEADDLELDEDGLWVCQACKPRLIGRPAAYSEVEREEDTSELDKRLQPLVGKSAGAICRTLELPFTPPYRTVIEAAQTIAYDEDRTMRNLHPIPAILFSIIGGTM